MHKKTLFTGIPGCGKTTIIKKIVQRLNRPSTGFFTGEIRERGRRVGFSIKTLDGRKGILAHVGLESRIRVGRYGVNLGDIDRIAVPAMIPENDHVVVVVDEVGKMECYSARFKRALMQALDAPNTVIGSIALKGDKFIQSVKNRPDTRIVSVSRKNRDHLADEFLFW